MTSLRNKIKNLIFFLFGNKFSSNYRIARLRKSGNIIILNLHRVSVDDGSGYKPLDPHLFEELLKFLKYNFEVVTFASIKDVTIKPKLILSFDDGFKDFIDVACPLLYKYDIRVNHNLIPECIETGLPPLNIIAQDFVGKAPKELIKRLEIPGFQNLSGDNLAYRLSSFIKNNTFDKYQNIRKILIPQFFSWDEFTTASMMNRSDILQIREIHEIGGHSYSHTTMQYEDEEFFINDLNRCKKYFKELLGHPMKIYAFPNGSHTENQIEIAISGGVEHVLLLGSNFDNGISPHYRFNFDAQNLNQIRFNATGGLKNI